MFEEFSAAAASAKAALDIVKAAHGLTNYNELVTAVYEVNAKLMDATAVALASQEKQAALSSEVAELKEKLRKVEDWESQIQRYSLHAFPTGALAYALRANMEQGQPVHYLCATCMDKKQKSTLQPLGHALRCGICNTGILIQNDDPHDFTYSAARGLSP